MKRLGALFCMVSAMTAGTARAADYYVSPSGSDGFSCSQARSISAAKRTIAGGAACLAAGDTLFVRGGSYDESITNGIASGSSWSNKVRIANYNGETVWMRPTVWATAAVFLYGAPAKQYIEFDGINIDASRINQAMTFGNADGNLPHHIRVQNAEIIGGTATESAGGIAAGAHVVEGAPGGFELRNLTIHGGLAYGIYLATSNSIVENCDIYDVGFAGIHIYNGGGDSPDNNTIRNCRIHDITRSYWFGNADPRSAGILVGGVNTEIYNNVIYGIDTGSFGSGEDVAISLYNTTRAKIWNNTIVDNDQDCILVGSGSSNSDVRNNICYGNTGSAFVNGGPGTIQSNNLFGVDPSFVNPSAKDFRLAAGSRAIDAGVQVSVGSDIAGTARPQGPAPDIGAFEYRNGQDSLAVPPAPPQPPTHVRIVSN